jgi:hypothetical protein
MMISAWRICFTKFHSPGLKPTMTIGAFARLILLSCVMGPIHAHCWIMPLLIVCGRLEVYFEQSHPSSFGAGVVDNLRNFWSIADTQRAISHN